MTEHEKSLLIQAFAPHLIAKSESFWTTTFWCDLTNGQAEKKKFVKHYECVINVSICEYFMHSNFLEALEIIKTFVYDTNIFCGAIESKNLTIRWHCIVDTR